MNNGRYSQKNNFAAARTDIVDRVERPLFEAIASRPLYAALGQRSDTMIPFIVALTELPADHRRFASAAVVCAVDTAAREVRLGKMELLELQHLLVEIKSSEFGPWVRHAARPVARMLESFKGMRDQKNFREILPSVESELEWCRAAAPYVKDCKVAPEDDTNGHIRGAIASILKTASALEANAQKAREAPRPLARAPSAARAPEHSRR